MEKDSKRIPKEFQGNSKRIQRGFKEGFKEDSKKDSEKDSKEDSKKDSKIIMRPSTFANRKTSCFSADESAFFKNSCLKEFLKYMTCNIMLAFRF